MFYLLTYFGTVNSPQEKKKKFSCDTEHPSELGFPDHHVPLTYLISAPGPGQS